MNLINPYGFIYITTNLINGKRYIGKKVFDGASRWKSYLGSGTYLTKAIKKYGRENFIRDIVDIAYSEEELNEKEKMWIENYNAVESDDFYNQIEGGETIKHLIRKNAIPIICIDNGMVFNSIAEASMWSGYSPEKIKKSFKKVHTKNYKNEDYIFRPYKEITKGQGYCIICGKIFNKNSNSQKMCKRKRCEKYRKSNSNNKSKYNKRNNKKRKVPNKYNISPCKKEQRMLRKQELMEKYKSTILDLYVNQRIPIYKIKEIINVKGIDHPTIKLFLEKWGVNIRKFNLNDKYIYYNAVFDSDGNMLNAFKYKHETREWLVSSGITETKTFTDGQLKQLIDKNKKYKGLIFKTIDEETYKKFKKEGIS